MARRKTNTLTELELELMNVLWRKGRATVQEIRDALAEQRPLAYTSISTMMGILEKKGYVNHESVGRSYVYSPLVELQIAPVLGLIYERRIVCHVCGAGKYTLRPSPGKGA